MKTNAAELVPGCNAVLKANERDPKWRLRRYEPVTKERIEEAVDATEEIWALPNGFDGFWSRWTGRIRLKKYSQIKLAKAIAERLILG